MHEREKSVSVGFMIKRGDFMEKGIVSNKLDFLRQFAELLQTIPDEDARQAGTYVLGYMAGVRTMAEQRERRSA